MIWLYATLTVLVLAAVAAVAAGRTGSWDEPEIDRVPVLVPDGEIGASNLRRVRFPIALRGYRMSEVDALLDRLATQLEAAHTSSTEPVAAEVSPSPEDSTRRNSAIQ